MYLYKCIGTHLYYLSSFVTWETLIAFLGWMLERRQVSLHVLEQAGYGSMQTNKMNLNNCLGVVAMLVCHLRAVKRIEFKPFKTTTIEVAYAKRAMFKRWDGLQVH